MLDDLRPLIRLARRLEQMLERPRPLSPILSPDCWDLLMAACRRLSWSRRHGWDAAARVCRRSVDCRVAALRQQLDEALRRIEWQIARRPCGRSSRI